MADDTQTIVITNFGGRLTRKLNGDMNSGFAKFATSWGYDPWSKPDNLTWFEQPVNIAGGNSQGTNTSSVTGLLLSAMTKFEVNTTYVYGVDNNAVLYKIQSNSNTGPNIDSPSVLASIGSGLFGAPSFSFGASTQFFGNASLIYISSDTRVDRINSDGSGFSNVTTSVVGNIYHPLSQFIGKLIIGNGNNIQTVDSTNVLATSVASSGTAEGFGVINPPLPAGTKVTDIDTSMDGNYLLLTGSNIPPENILTPSQDRQQSAGGSGVLFRWNGVDQGITSETFIASDQLSALQTFLGNQIIFANDSFGGAVTDGVQKLLTLVGDKSPLPNATQVNGNFVTWVTPEVDQNSSMVGAMFYYGQLDQENPAGLWRVMRQYPSLVGGFVYQTPVNVLVNNAYKTVNNSLSSVVSYGYGKHYFSLWEVAQGNSSVSSSNTKLFRFLVTSSGTGVPQKGIYETQTQLFSRKSATKLVRVYTEPTIPGNSFQIDLIASNGSVMASGSSIYTYTAGTDTTLLQGSQDRINFNFNTAPFYAVGVRITNLGSTNFTIKKLEVEVAPAGS